MYVATGGKTKNGIHYTKWEEKTDEQAVQQQKTAKSKESKEVSK